MDKVLDNEVNGILDKLNQKYTPNQIAEISKRLGDLFTFTEKLKGRLKEDNPNLSDSEILDLACEEIERILDSKEQEQEEK